MSAQPFCRHVGGPVVKVTPKTFTWVCSQCGRRRRERRDGVHVIDLRTHVTDSRATDRGRHRVG